MLLQRFPIAVICLSLHSLQCKLRPWVDVTPKSSVVFLHVSITQAWCFNKVPDILQVFEIVVDSLKFSVLFLYILWDDWFIFIISGSKEQLQQQLEYTKRLGLLCWRSKGVQEEIRSEEASTLQIGSVTFPSGQCTSRQLHPCNRLFD